MKCLLAVKPKRTQSATLKAKRHRETEKQLLRRLAGMIQKLFGRCRCNSARGGFNFRIGLAQSKKKENQMLSITLTNEQKVTVTLTPVTDTGKPALLDGVPTWTLIAGDSTVEPSADGLSAVLISSDTPGVSEFEVSADADLGEGVEQISEIVQLNVASATAKNLGLVASKPEPKA